MSRYYCELCDQPVTPAKDGDCPHCGAGLSVMPIDNPREKDDDDGREYADPRDYRDGLE
jgi:hypothetical protein